MACASPTTPIKPVPKSASEAAPAVHHGHQVGQDQRLVVIVCHVHGGDLELPQQDLEIHPVLLAQRLVEIGEGLVDQEQAGVARDAAAERHALLLAAGERGRLAIEQLGQLHAHQLARALVLGPGQGVELRRLPPEQEVRQHVGPRGHVRIERVALEDHADAPLARRHVGHVDVVVTHHAGVGRHQAGDQLQQGGLAAPARAQHDHGAAVGNPQRDVLDGERHATAAPGVAKRLAHADRCAPRSVLD